MSIGAHRTNESSFVRNVRFDEGKIVIEFSGGTRRELDLSAYPTLARAPDSVRQDWVVVGPDKGIRWETLDLDVSLQGLALGLPERFPAPPSGNGSGLAGSVSRREMQQWVSEALEELGGEAPIEHVTRAVWDSHGSEIVYAGKLFYTWQYELRWAADLLRRKGVLAPAGRTRRGTWKLAGARASRRAKRAGGRRRMRNRK